jgi:vacuolar-type H+-ATPase subunit H
MSGGESTANLADVSGLVTAIREAHDRRRRLESKIESHGEETVRQVADAYDRATRLLDQYEDKATGTGRENFKSYVEFQEAFLELTEGLPDDLPHRDAFETANDGFDKRRLSESDFERARELLAPVADVADLLDRRAEAKTALRDARSDARRRQSELGDRIEELEQLTALGDADLDAPVEDLREPITAYDDAVREAFREYRRESSARDVLRFVRDTGQFPLVEYRQPPSDLWEYVQSYPAGEESIPQLLEYAGYSQSKLDHYVDDPTALRTRVGTHRTYLERLDGEPLTIGWPPPQADHLRYRLVELVAVVGRFAPESVVADLRDLRSLTDDAEWYARLRESALARTELGDEERERLAAGEVADELEACRRAHDRLAEALAEYETE